MRELENVVERSVILSTGPELVVPLTAIDTGIEPSAAPLPAQKRVSSATATGALQTLADVERAFILKALEQTNWVVSGRSGAAARIGLSRTTLQARMRKHGLSRPR